MHTKIRIATQNLNWGGEPTAPGGDGEPRLERLVRSLEKLDADLLVLTEFKTGALEQQLRELLAQAGYPHLLSHTQGPYCLGTAIASRRAMTVVKLPIPPATDPWRSIGVNVDGINVFGFYFPLKDAKSPYWDWLLANAEKLRDLDTVLLGDFNTGKIRIDEAGESFDCQEKHEALEALGFVDAWRAAYPKGRDYTWYSTVGNGFRLDYIWASPSLARRIQRAWHDHEARLTLSSDHSAVVVDLATPESTPMTESTVALDERNVLKNIFKLMDYVGPEDRFTAAFGYVLDREPTLAQSVANILLKDRGVSPKVIRVTDHPDCNSLKRPDFRIECEGLDILVEHKLDALLHENQLQNYLELQILQKPNTYLALIAPSYQPVPDKVLGHASYLKPEGKDHFRWSDFHEAVKSQPGWLTQEFADYMASLGMAPFTLKGAEDIFDMRAKPVQFAEALKVAVDQVFAKVNPGCWHKGTATGRGREIRAPSEHLTLIYIWAEQRSSYVRDFDRPVLAVNVYERDIAGISPLKNATIETSSGFTVRRHVLDKPGKQGEGHCRITYLAPVEKIIEETRDATVQKIVDMLAVVRADHLAEL